MKIFQNTAASITERIFITSTWIDGDKGIIAGHGRLAALFHWGQ